ncbi:MAG TPA: hypothetical protein VN748_13090 [Pseudonocardiaceae bacterium]|nr:hypothetical protein [Pseudonocardiaceae bacterium]
MAARTLRDIGDLSGTLKEFRRSVRTRKARVRSGLWGPALAAGPSTRDDLRKRATVETWDKKKEKGPSSPRWLASRPLWPMT